MAETYIGKPAPSFKGMAVVDGAFKEISLADFKGKYLVLFFYPLDLYDYFMIYSLAIQPTRVFDSFNYI